MGSELYRMIRDGAPPEWTPQMRLVALAVADDARDPSHGMPEDGGWPWSAMPVRGSWRGSRWRDGLAERTGMSERTISRALTDLAAVGYEMREPLGPGRDGRVVFTAPGRAMRFRVPRLPPRDPPARPPHAAAVRSPHTAADGVTPARYGDHSALERSPNLAERSPDLAPTVARYGDPITPVSPQHHLTPLVAVSGGAVEGSRNGAATTTDLSERDRWLLTAWRPSGRYGRFAAGDYEASKRVHDLATTAACPACGQPPGADCRRGGGQTMGAQVHVARKTAAAGAAG